MLGCATFVAGSWQARGVGSLLLDTLLQHAQSEGIALLHGITLATNQAMHNLARRLGFVLLRDPQDATLRRVEKALARPDLPPRVIDFAGDAGIAAASDGGNVPRSQGTH